MLDQKTQEIIKSTAPIIKEKGEEITTRMYEILFSKYPETKELFKNAPKDQYKRLANAIFAYSANIDRLDALQEAIERMARKHVETNVKPEHYPLVKDALLTAIKEVLNPPQEILEAWDKAYDLLADVLIEREKQLYMEKTA
ncbi:MAG: hypothetical protein DSY47_05875 [Hydrogenothermus sp.]|nr:MAG: hypothetical protein DSY47_05875 [Hydrogenothermus sp.]